MARDFSAARQQAVLTGTETRIVLNAAAGRYSLLPAGPMRVMPKGIAFHSAATMPTAARSIFFRTAVRGGGSVMVGSARRGTSSWRIGRAGGYRSMSDARSEQGFTLLEVLVALAIAVLSFAVLFRLIAADLDRTRAARDQTEAAALLQSLLAQSALAPMPGVTRGAFPNGYAWRVEVAPYTDDGAAADGPVDAMTVAATVSWQDGGLTRSRSLTTLRAVPRAAAR